MPVPCEKTENHVSAGVHLSKLPKNGELATILRFGEFTNLTWQYEPRKERDKELVVVVYYSTLQDAVSAQMELDNLRCGDSVLKAVLVSDEQRNLIGAEGDSLPEAGPSNKERQRSANESERTEEPIHTENETSDASTGSNESEVSRESKSFRERQKRKSNDSHSSLSDDTQFSCNVWAYQDHSEMEHEYPYRAAEISNCNFSIPYVGRLYKPIGEKCWQVHIEKIGINTTCKQVENYFRQFGNIFVAVVNEPWRRYSSYTSADIYLKTLYEAANVAKLTNGCEFNSNIISVGIVSPPNKCRASDVSTRDMSAVSEINEVIYGDVGEHDWPVQVSNFMDGTSHDDIKQLFKHFGEITRIRMYSPRFKINDFDYVEAEIFFKTHEQAAQSFIMDNVMYNNRLIRVCMPDNVVQVSNWSSDLPMDSLHEALSLAGLVNTVMPIQKSDGSFDVVWAVYHSSQAASRAEAQFHKLNVLGRDLKIKQLNVVAKFRKLTWIPTF